MGASNVSTVVPAARRANSECIFIKKKNHEKALLADLERLRRGRELVAAPADVAAQLPELQREAVEHLV